MVRHERNTRRFSVLEKYVPIPQWVEKGENRTIGVKDLYLVHTVESDYWIKKVQESYEVYGAYLKKRMLICESMTEAVQFIKECSMS